MSIVHRRAGACEGRPPLVVQFAKNPGQLATVGLAQSIEESFGLRPARPAHLLAQLPSTLGELDQGRPPVLRIGAPPNELLRFEVVDHLSDRSRGDPQVLGQFRRAQCTEAGDHAKRASLRRGDVPLCHRLLGGVA